MFRFCRNAPLFILIFALALSPLIAYESGLSEIAIRDAYFLGQRHDNTLPAFYSKYASFPPEPKTGPHISEIRFLTPFEQLVEFCEQQHGNYDAQQALLDHRGKRDFVKVIVRVAFTASYGRFLPAPQGASGQSNVDVPLRSLDFWKSVRVSVSDDARRLAPSRSYGRPTYSGAQGINPCPVTGAYMEFFFPADAFTSQTAFVRVVPPEGDPVIAEFDLSSLR